MRLPGELLLGRRAYFSYETMSPGDADPAIRSERVI